MARTDDDDTWDVNESVGVTALGVAVDDPFARLFLDAAGDGVWKIFLSDEPPAELAEVDTDFGKRTESMRSYIGSRTKYFDEFFLDAAAAGVGQSVIPAAGLEPIARLVDVGELLYDGKRTEVTDWLGAHG
ncbi:class I SAM-dependent methyltransferase [Mycobacterium sp. AT1]|uniref:class I SAM-dependent methyltransferase n=1 Tax=Mycobacterium sp. AT1 TaxID=1961706 RepID=UPI0009CB5F9D|nr:hypothetical protein B1790_09550 [Mycobacterium sp. AT1]